MPDTTPLTTGQVARHCQVSQATIINWIKEGKLKAYTTPGGHYRVLPPDLVSFLDTYHMPVDTALRAQARPRELLVSDSPHTARLAQTLQANRRLELVEAGDDYEAGAQVARFRPTVVVLNMASTRLDCLALCRRLRTSPEGREIRVLAVGRPADEEEAWAAGVDAYLPIDPADRLADELDALLENDRLSRRENDS